MTGWIWLALLVLAGLIDLGLWLSHKPTLSQWVWQQEHRYPWGRGVFLAALFILTLHLVWGWP